MVKEWLGEKQWKESKIEYNKNYNTEKIQYRSCRNAEKERFPFEKLYNDFCTFSQEYFLIFLFSPNNFLFFIASKEREW